MTAETLATSFVIIQRSLALDEAVLTNISEMIDLAIGTPEVGVVDFGMLQTVLHCLAQQLRVLGKNVELRGSVAALPVGRPGENTQSIAISEFIVDTGAGGGFELAKEPPAPGTETMLVVERTRKVESPTGSSAPRGVPSAASGQASGGKSAGGRGPGGRPGGVSTTGATPSSVGPGQATSKPGLPSSDAIADRGTAPSGQMTAPSGQMSAPSGQMTAPSGQMTAPSGQMTAPSGQMTAPSGQMTSPSMAAQGPRSMTGVGPSTEKLSLVTLSKFNLLENTVEDLKNRVYGSMPKNEDLLQEVRSQSNLKAITDMWTNLNVSSRLEAAEEGIGKLSSLIQDLIGETVELQKATGAPPSAAASKMAQAAKSVTAAVQSPRGQASSGGGIGGVSTASAQGMQGAQGAPGAPGTGSTPTFGQQSGTVGAPSGVTIGPSGVALGSGGLSGTAGQPSQAVVYGQPSVDLSGMATKGELMELYNLLQMMKNDLDTLTDTFYTAMKEVNKNFVPPPPSGGARSAAAGKPVSGIQYAQSPMGGNAMEKLIELEKQLQKCCETINKSEGVVNDQLTSFQDQLDYMSKQIAGLSLDSGAGKLSPDLVKDLKGLMQLFQTVQDMQTQLKQVHDTALQLAAEKEERQNHIDALLEQIELLKTIKLDREDMVEALADKADLRMLARKVSHDQFEMACDDLSKGLEHALGKLNVQESLWQQALDDIQREIETKLDKMELSPVKEFFNNKLKQLQENLKQMAALRREAEAAGTKRRLLRDVNCISCDAKAVMPMDAASPLPPKPLPANLSMKPYLSYELDAIRKAQASGIPQRNMHDWEHIDKQMQPRQPYKVRSETDKHLCNRYCGGSHTVTTPAQRVARLGHFIKQWGPEVLPLSSGFAAGDDGRLYKVTNVEGASVGPGGAVEGAAPCTPKSPVKKAEPPKGPKPIIISAECRCLDPTAERPSKT